MATTEQTPGRPLPDSYPVTARTTPSRHRDRAGYGAGAIHQVLDEALICHVGCVVDGEPLVLPNIHSRVGDVLYLHGSTGARVARQAAAGGVPVCVTVTLLDGLVLARSQFNHSMNYRSVVVRGVATAVTEPAEKAAALASVVEHVVAGRAAHSRAPLPRELAATQVLRVPLREASLKHRAGGPGDDPEDLGLPYWAGVLPVATVFGAPQGASDLAPGIDVPPHVTGYGRP